jgi:flagellar hook-associated protein 2
VVTVAGSIDGLVSGLSTSTLIAQLMQIEAAPQLRLKNRVAAEDKTIGAYRAINIRLAALETAAGTMANLTTWQAAKATSSSPSVTAVASSSSTPGSTTFDVTSLARAQVSTATVAATGDITTGGTVDITIGGTTHAVDVSADRSAQGVADAINAKKAGVTASLITTSTGVTVLQISGGTTGSANAFTVTGLNATVETAVAATDAVLQVGDPATGGYTVNSSTNTFTTLLAGTAITVSKLESGVTVDVTADADAIAKSMKSLVDAANAALSEIGAQSSTTASTVSPLTGDSMARQIADHILGAVTSGVDGYGDLAQFGVEVDRHGKLTFDAEKFATAYATDPSTLHNAASAFAGKVQTLADSHQQNMTNAVTGRTSLVDNLNEQIDRWDARLAARRLTLERQFTGLERALSSLQSQSNWLAGQLGALG